MKSLNRKHADARSIVRWRKNKTKVVEFWHFSPTTSSVRAVCACVGEPPLADTTLYAVTHTCACTTQCDRCFAGVLVHYLPLCCCARFHPAAAAAFFQPRSGFLGWKMVPLSLQWGYCFSTSCLPLPVSMAPLLLGCFLYSLLEWRRVDIVWMVVLLFLELIIFVSYLDKPLRHTISAGGSLCHETNKSEIVNWTKISWSFIWGCLCGWGWVCVRIFRRNTGSANCVCA